MAVRWTITFKTLTNRTGLVKVYDSSYSGDPIALTPAANPFSVSCRQSELITPVVSDSGYLRIIDEGDAASYVDELHPQGSMDRPVEFYLDNVLTWRGYISPETFSGAWEPAPREVELPLVGALDILDSINVTNNGTGLQSIATFLVEIMNATGFTFDSVIIPRQMVSVNGYDDIPEVRLSLSRYNFLSLNDSEYLDDPDWTEFVGVSWKKVLEDVCQYFGWTASAQASVLVLTSPRTDVTEYMQVTRADLAAVEGNFSDDIPYTELERGTVTQLDWDGVNHRRSISNGKRRITVRSGSPAPEGVFPEILFNGDVEYEGEYEYSGSVHSTGVSHAWDVKGRNKVLNISREHVTLHKYQVTDIGTASESYHEIDWDYPEAVDDMVGPGAYIVKSFSDGWRKEDGTVVDGSDSTTVKEMFVNALRLTGNKGLVPDGSSEYSTDKHFTETVPLASIRSRAKCCFPAGGCLCITAQVQNSFFSSLTNVMGWIIDPSGMSMWGKFMNYLKCSLRIGTSYYNGQTWVAGGGTPPVFDVSCLVNGKYSTSEMSKNGIGNIADRLDIQIPSTGAVGFLAPLDWTLEGEVELTFYNWAYTLPSNGASTGRCFVSLFLSNLNFVYYKGSDSETKDLCLSRLAGKNYQDNLDISLNLSSSNDNRISQSLLWFGIMPKAIGGPDVTLVYPDSQTLAQPEQWLISTLLMLYTNPSEELVLEVGYDSTLKVYDIVYIGGKQYVITGRETSFADEHIRLYITSYE